MSKKLAIAMFGQKRLSREGGVEIVVKELCTRMAQNGCDVTCYNRAGHHVSGAEYDDAGKTEYEGIRQKTVPTIERLCILGSLSLYSDNGSGRHICNMWLICFNSGSQLKKPGIKRSLSTSFDVLYHYIVFLNINKNNLDMSFI